MVMAQVIIGDLPKNSFNHSPQYCVWNSNGKVSVHLMHWSPESNVWVVDKEYFSGYAPFSEVVELARRVYDQWRPQSRYDEPYRYSLYVRDNAILTDFGEIERRVIIYLSLRNYVRDRDRLIDLVVGLPFIAGLYWGGELLRARELGFKEFVRVRKALRVMLGL